MSIVQETRSCNSFSYPSPSVASASWFQISYPREATPIGLRPPTSSAPTKDTTPNPSVPFLGAFPEVEQFLRHPTFTKQKCFKIPSESFQSVLAEAEEQYPDACENLRFNYDGGTLTINTLPLCAHEVPISIIQNAFGVWKSSNPDSKICSLGSTSIHALPWEESTTFQADFSIAKPSNKNQATIPRVVFECALSQTRENAVEKALKWLTRFGFKVRLVIILDIQRQPDGSLKEAYWEEWARSSSNVIEVYPYAKQAKSQWTSRVGLHSAHAPEACNWSLEHLDNCPTDVPCYHLVEFNNRPQPQDDVEEGQERERWTLETGVILKKRVKIFPSYPTRPEKLSIDISKVVDPAASELSLFEIKVGLLEEAIVENVEELMRDMNRGTKRKCDDDSDDDESYGSDEREFLAGVKKVRAI